MQPSSLPHSPAAVRDGAPLPAPLAAGTPAYRNAKWALFIGSFATFAMFYGPQPLLPLFGSAFALTPAQASGVLSVTAGAMALGLLLMGSFVSLYNYLGFRLGGAPFGLSHAAIGAIFLLYMVGMFSSPWAGHRADRIGSTKVMAGMLGLMAAGVLITLASTLPIIIAGVTLFTFGFFGAHSVACAWVGRLARRSKPLASAAYFTAYYAGAAAMGWLGGHAWSARAWPGVVAFLAMLWLSCVAVAWRLARDPAAQAADG